MTIDEALEILDTIPTISEQVDALEMAIEALRSSEKPNKWIPVSERLPESSGVYIVSRWFSDGEESAILVDANYYDGNGDWYNDNRINWGRELVTNRIVAWMPLPEPYKAEGDVEE